MTGFDFAQNDAEKQALATQAQAMQQQPPEKLNKPTWEQITKILRDDKLRGFRVDIETDSTVMPDAAAEQQNRIELLTAISGFVTGIAPAVQSGAIPMDLAKEMLSFGVRAFKVSPQLEDALDQIGQNDGQDEKGQAAQMKVKELEQQMQQMQQELQDKRAEGQKMQNDAQVAQMNAQNDALKLQIDQFNAETNRIKVMQEAQPQDTGPDAAKLQIEQMKLALEERIAKLDSDTQILIEQMKINEKMCEKTLDIDSEVSAHYQHNPME